MDRIWLGNRIKKYREQREYSRDKLAEKAEIGSKFLGEVERGEKTTSLVTFVKLAAALSVSVDELLGVHTPAGKVVVHNEIASKLESLPDKYPLIISDILEVLLKHDKE